MGSLEFSALAAAQPSLEKLMKRTAMPTRYILLLVLFVFGSSLAEAQRGRSSTSRSSSSSSSSSSRSSAQSSRSSSGSRSVSRPSTSSRSSSRSSTSSTTRSRPTSTSSRSRTTTRSAPPTTSSRTRSTSSAPAPSSSSRTSWGTRYDSGSSNSRDGSGLFYPSNSSSSNSRDLGSFRGTNSDYGSNLEYAPVSESVRRGLDWYQSRGDSSSSPLAPSEGSAPDNFGLDSDTYDLGRAPRPSRTSFPRPFFDPQPDPAQTARQRRSLGTPVPRADSSGSVRSILDRYRGGSDRGPSPADLTDIVNRNRVTARQQSESDSPYAAGPFGRLSSAWLQSNRALEGSRRADPQGQDTGRDRTSDSNTEGDTPLRSGNRGNDLVNSRPNQGGSEDQASGENARAGRTAALPTPGNRSPGRSGPGETRNARAGGNNSRSDNLGGTDGIALVGPASARGGLPKADRSQLQPGSKLDTDTVFPGGDDDGGSITPPAGGDTGNGGSGDHHGDDDHGWNYGYNNNCVNHFNYYYPYWSNFCGFGFGFYGFHSNFIWGSGLYWANAWPLFYPNYFGGYGGYSQTTVIVEQQPVVSDYAPYYESTGRPAQEARTPKDTQASFAAAERYLGLGDRAFREGRYGDAVHFYAKAIEFAPEEGVLYLVLADALFATGDYHYGAYALRRALDYSPHLFDSQINKRSFYGNPEAFDRQLAVLERYVRDLPFDGDARLMLAVNYLFSGRAEDAVAILKAPEGSALLREDGVQLLLQEASSN